MSSINVSRAPVLGFACFIYVLSWLFFALIYAEVFPCVITFLKLDSSISIWNQSRRLFFCEILHLTPHHTSGGNYSKLEKKIRKKLNLTLPVVKSLVKYCDIRKLDETRTKIIIRMHFEFNIPGVISRLWKSAKIPRVNSIIAVAVASMTFACTEYCRVLRWLPERAVKLLIKSCI